MLPANPPLSRVLITICGSVQGIGFRPFIYRLAHQHQLAGQVINTCQGVKIDVQGDHDAIAEFQLAIKHQKHKRAIFTDFKVEDLPCGDYTSFKIGTSDSDSDKALALLPDTALCAECLQELFDPTNRRYLYPFLHCITCGPRFSLFSNTPFDRGNTSMQDFLMCHTCESEYNDPTNRRFFSQTNCCSECGPKLQLVDSNRGLIANHKESLDHTVEALRNGKIIAMKNTGGYLLLVDGTNEEAVKRLRAKKRRPSKPFALLMPNLAAVQLIAHMNSIEEDVLTSPAAPIVLLRKKALQHSIAPPVSHASPYHGVMLPNTPLQHLLIQFFATPLVATSGNLSGFPLCIDEEEAFNTLGSVADLFLIHNRIINHRLDDSIVQIVGEKPVILRMGRGYVPYAISLPNTLRFKGQEELFAAGSQMKNSFAFLKNGKIYMSQHIGDLDTVENCRAYAKEVSGWEKLLGMKNPIGIGDKHPGYYSTQFLESRGAPLRKIQHHEAHAWGGMADNNLSPPALCIIWDGTGWGDDITIWGGEAFLITERKINRVATLYPFPLPGGDKAIREPRRAMLGLLHALFGDEIPPPYLLWLNDAFSPEELGSLSMALRKKINTPICSSVGRLFDAVSAILNLCQESDFEGQAALLLETMAHLTTDTNKAPYQVSLINEKGLWSIDWRPAIKRILSEKATGVPTGDIALAFHRTLAQAILEIAKVMKVDSVLLSGGVMQNKLLVEEALSLLKAAGFTPYTHSHVPPNDGGIAVGQIRGLLSSDITTSSIS